MNRKGFAPLIIIGIIAIIAIAGIVIFASLSSTQTRAKIGDLNIDGQVDCKDVALVCSSMGKKVGDIGFDSHVGVLLENPNGTMKDEAVSSATLKIVTDQLPQGMTCPPCPIQQDTSTHVNVTSANSTTTPTVDTSSWKVYTDNAYDFSFKYPANIFLKGGSNPASIVLSHEVTSTLEGSYDVSVVFEKNPNGLSVKQFFSGQNGADLYSGAVVSTTTVSNLSATSFNGSLYDMAPQETVVIPYQGGFLEVANNNLDSASFQKILTSFQFWGTD
jgi:hypothetical protein